MFGHDGHRCEGEGVDDSVGRFDGQIAEQDVADDLIVLDGDEGGSDQTGIAQLVDELSFFGLAEGLVVNAVNCFAIGGLFEANGDGGFG